MRHASRARRGPVCEPETRQGKVRVVNERVLWDYGKSKAGAGASDATG